MTVTFEPLLRFYFFKRLDISEFNFLLIKPAITTRQREPRGDFGQNGSYWNYLHHLRVNFPDHGWCNGEYAISNKHVRWAPDKPVYKHLHKNR